MTNQEAIKTLNSGVRYRYTSSDYPIARDMAIKALEEQDRNRWIPVSERLPEEDREILVCTKCGNVWHVYYVGNEQYRFSSDYSRFMLAKPIAWMQLPEPFKEDAE